MRCLYSANLQRRSGSGESLLSWLTRNRKAYLKQFAKASKNEPLVEEVELVNVNPMFARVRCPSGREASVNLRDLGFCPGDVALRQTKGQRSSPESLKVNGKNADNDCVSRVHFHVMWYERSAERLTCKRK